MKLVLIVASVVGFALWGTAGEIHEAARDGNLARVQAIVSASPDSVNARDKGTTPLHEAARAGRLDVVRFLIEHKANPNVNDISKTTPLRLAIGYRRAEVAEFLRQHGALERIETPVVAQPSPTRATPAPSTSLPPRIVTIPPARLATNPPAANAPNRGTNAFVARTNAAAGTNRVSIHDLLPVVYPIHEAARLGDVEQIKFLFKSFPDLIESTDEKGQTPLHVATANKQYEAAKALVGLRAKVNAKNDSGQTPLHLAARISSSALVQLLLTNRADANALDNFQRTPLLMATLPLERDELSGLSERDARVQFRSPQAHAAAANAQAEQLQVVRLLLERGAKANAQNRAGATPLSQAVLTLNEGMLNLLIRAGADPNIADPSTKATPLHISAGRGLTNAAALLLSANANPDARDARGETPVGHALHGGHVGIANMLQQRGGTIGAEQDLTPVESSLVDYFRRNDNALQHGSPGAKAQIIVDMSPSRADVARMFPQHAAAAWNVVSEMRKQIKQSFQNSLVDSEQGKEIWRIRTENPTPLTREWLQRGWLNSSLPIFSLVVDRVGSTSYPGDYCFVNQRWVLMPPLRTVAAMAGDQGN